MTKDLESIIVEHLESIDVHLAAVSSSLEFTLDKVEDEDDKEAIRKAIVSIDRAQNALDAQFEEQEDAETDEETE